MQPSMIRTAPLLAMSQFQCSLLAGSQAANQDGFVIAWKPIEGITPVAGFTGQFIEGSSPVGTGNWMVYGVSRRPGGIEP